MYLPFVSIVRVAMQIASNNGFCLTQSFSFVHCFSSLHSPTDVHGDIRFLPFSTHPPGFSTNPVVNAGQGRHRVYFFDIVTMCMSLLSTLHCISGGTSDQAAPSFCESFVCATNGVRHCEPAGWICKKLVVQSKGING
jgi:hypothetical protein